MLVSDSMTMASVSGLSTPPAIKSVVVSIMLRGAAKTEEQRGILVSRS